MKEAITRLISGALMVALMVWAILFSLTGAQILFGFIVFVASWEYFRMTKAKSVLCMVGATAAVGVYGVFILMASEAMDVIKAIFFSLTAALCILRLFTSAADSNVIRRLHGLFLVSVPFAILSDWLYRDHACLVLSFFVLIWTNDVMAYITGRLFGKTKLMVKVSPGKTWEGFFGGLLFTGLVAYFGNKEFEFFSTTLAIVFGLVVSVFGTMGDLFESRAKRMAGVKDSGTIMPGHGGLLDRFDGLLISLPILYILFDYSLNLLL